MVCPTRAGRFDYWHLESYPEQCSADWCLRPVRQRYVLKHFPPLQFCPSTRVLVILFWTFSWTLMSCLSYWFLIKEPEPKSVFFFSFSLVARVCFGKGRGGLGNPFAFPFTARFCIILFIFVFVWLSWNEFRFISIWLIRFKNSNEFALTLLL